METLDVSHREKMYRAGIGDLTLLIGAWCELLRLSDPAHSLV